MVSKTFQERLDRLRTATMPEAFTLWCIKNKKTIQDLTDEEKIARFWDEVHTLFPELSRLPEQ